MREKTIRLSGMKLMIRIRILLAKISLLNMDTMLKGIPIKELKKAIKVKVRRTGCMVPPDVIDERYMEIGKIIAVIRAVTNEKVVNIFKFLLSNQITSLS